MRFHHKSITTKINIITFLFETVLRLIMSELEELKNSLRDSFAKVKKDIATHDNEIREIKNLLLELNNKLDLLIKNDKHKVCLSNFPYETKGSQKVVSLRHQRDSNLEIEFLRKLKRNKKNIIKSKILDLIKNEQMNKSQLKSLIVDQLNYCSKASLYRYLKEMIYEGQINLVNSSEKEYFVVSNL